MYLRRPIRARFARAILLATLVVLQAGTSRAEWTQTTGPKGGLVRSFAAVPDGAGGSSLFAGQIRVWRTDDHGSSWSHLGSGLTDPNAFALLAVPDGFGGNDLLVGTNGGVFRSSDGGANWSPINHGITNPSVYALASGSNGSGGTNLYAGTYMGNAFRSTDGGANWTAINAGLPTGYNVNVLLATASGTVLAGTSNGIYRSTNFGDSWTRVFTLYGLSLARDGATIYAGSSNGVYRSTNDGASWTAINNGMGFIWVQALAAIPNGAGVTLFAGAGGVLRSADDGATWAPVNNGLSNLPVYALTTAPNTAGGTDLYAGTGEGVFRSADLGDSWTDVSFVYSRVQALEVAPGGALLAGTENNIFRSTDAGATWTETQSGTTALDFAVNPHGVSGVSIFSGGSPAGIYKSTNGGATWFGSSNALDDFDVNSMAAVPDGSGGTNLLAGTYSGLFISRDDGGFWQRAGLNTLPLDFLVTPNGSGGHNIYAAGFGGVWISNDHGTVWTPVNTGLTDKIVQGIAATSNGATLFAGGDPFGVYRSTDGGATWGLRNDGLTDLRIFALLSPDGTNLLAAGAGGVFLSTDDGDHWTSAGSGLTTGVFSLALSAEGTTLLAGTTGFGVWKRPLSEMIGLTGVAMVPAAIVLHANHPNPFNPATTIEYSLSEQMPVRLAIFDVGGRRVRTLADAVQEAGARRVLWDGRDERGATVGSGVYLCRLEARGASLTRKMSLLK